MGPSFLLFLLLSQDHLVETIGPTSIHNLNCNKSDRLKVFQSYSTSGSFFFLLFQNTASFVVASTATVQRRTAPSHQFPRSRFFSSAFACARRFLSTSALSLGINIVYFFRPALLYARKGKIKIEKNKKQYCQRWAKTSFFTKS